jgi:hypothetical protein
VENLARAGIAVEAMCFSDFPTETESEALDTLRFLASAKDDVALFIVGRFDLTHGSLIAQKPKAFGVGDVFEVAGDELGTGLFYVEPTPSKSSEAAERLESALDELARGYFLNPYPWAGALSTAHTLLWFAQHGRGAFKGANALRPTLRGDLPFARARVASARYDAARMDAIAARNEATIWQALIYERREVTREVYAALAAAIPEAHPAPGTFRYAAGRTPVAVGARGGVRLGLGRLSPRRRG